MKKNVFQMSKSVLLIRRALLLLSLLACSLFVNAGKSWTARYQVNIDATGSTGSGTVYLSAEETFANATTNSTMDKVAAISTSSAFSPTSLTASMNLDRKMDIPEKDDYKTARNTKCQHKNIRIRAVASPGSTFKGWKNSVANNSVITFDITIECDDEVSNGSVYTKPNPVVTYYPIFAIRTYYYATPAAQTTEGGTICTTGTTSTRPEAGDALWSTAPIAQGTTQPQTADNNGADARATIGTYYYHAKANNNYDFLGWYDKNGSKLSENEDFGYNLVATSENENSPTTAALTAMFAPKSPATIYPSDVKNTGLETGTELSADKGFPYRKKTLIDLTRTFDKDGNALFDKLYIFGMTTNLDGGTQINQPSNVTPCNAKTLCYVYKKSGDEKYYEYETMFDAVSTRFDHGTSMNGKHLYFTGYCPFAYVGDQYTQNGWMYFQGKTGVSDQVDIYLDSCQIFARLKTPNGNHGAYNNYDLVLSIEQLGETENDINYNYLSGYSSPFVFTSGTKNSGTSFRPTIHIAGKNHVKGQLGSLIHNTIADVTPVLGALGSLAGDVTKINLGISGVNTYSAPIAVKPTDVGQYTDLTMTDIWKDNTITNGYIRLDAADVPGKVAEAALSIDLGSATGSLTINGGQYHMRNAAADGNYTCNLAVGYKMYNRSEEALGATLQVRLYGFGNDQTDSKVTINSGTFTMYKNMYVLSPGNYLGTDYYKDQTNFLDLRLPAGNGNSRINGGTFNGISNVVTCKSTISTGADPTNGKYWLTLWDVPITGTNPDGSAQFSLDDIELIQVAYPAEPIVTYTLVNDIENVKNANQYGGQSANAYKKTIDAVEKDVVTLLLPGDLFGLPEKSEVQLRNWVTAVPYLEASKKLAGLVDVSLTVGGPIDVEVSSMSENIKYENKQLIFADLEGLEEYQYTIQAQGAGMKIKKDENAFGQINNTDSYEITNNLNLLKVVQADTWYTFTAPFDVHEISVIEANNSAYQESTIATNNRADAMKLQSEANLHFMYGIYTFILPNDEGRASSLTFQELLGQSSVLQNKQKLIHYDGENVMSANYYLYELASEVFETGGTGKELEIVWEPVATPDAEDPILEQGKVYAMQFPWCSMCNDLADREYYDYWSNKMILFYGKGPQEIQGSSYQQSTILKTTPAEGYATLVGNSTFAKMTLPASAGYVHNTSNDFFEKNNSAVTIKPTQGYMVYGGGAKGMPARISRSGQMEYDENVETGVDGVPTVGDRTSLMLFGAYDGFEVLALHEQLVTVYNLQGNIIFQQYMAEGEQVYVATGAGVFIVRGESETIKVMVD